MDRCTTVILEDALSLSLVSLSRARALSLACTGNLLLRDDDQSKTVQFSVLAVLAKGLAVLLVVSMINDHRTSDSVLYNDQGGMIDHPMIIDSYHTDFFIYRLFAIVLDVATRLYGELDKIV